MKTTMSDSAKANQRPGETQQQAKHSSDPTMKLVVSLGSRALEEALVALVFDHSGLPDLARAETAARAVIEMGGLLMASLMCIKGSGSLAESSDKIKAAWSEKMRQELGDRLMEIAAPAVARFSKRTPVATNRKHPPERRPYARDFGQK
jgi:hypothetical protein